MSVASFFTFRRLAMFWVLTTAFPVGQGGYQTKTRRDRNSLCRSG